MQTVTLGRTRERIPAIGMGTWKMPNDSSACVEALVKGASMGMTLIDTAEMYANEEMVGRALRAIGGDIFLATKVSPHHFREKDVVNACDASLRRLGVDSIDLYQLHWPNHSVPIRETMRAMEGLVKDGKVRHIGVSNFSIEEMIDAQAALKAEEIVSNQVEYSVFVRGIEHDLLRFCQKERVTVIAYSPLARGAISRPSASSVQKVLDDLSRRHAKTRAQVALNYLIAHGVVAIPKASSLEHVEENSKAAGWRLTRQELHRLASAGSQGRPMASGPVGWLAKNMSVWSSLLEKMERSRRAKGAHRRVRP